MNPTKRLDSIVLTANRIVVELSAECVVENALAQVFGSEWSALSESDRAVIVRDCTEEGGVSDLGAYRRNIGAGNLFRYVLTQRVRFTRRPPSSLSR
jgi:hypothetical protein